jgi:hypothetical protein
MNTSSQSERVSLDCLEAMIRELDKLSRELAAAFEQVLRADSGPPDDVARLEKHVAELIVGFQRQREGVFAEAQRQGRGSRDLDAIFARCVGALPPVDFQLSQDSSGTGSELTRWHGSAGAGRADAQVVLGFVLLAAR